jgi:hypothetical protein
MEPLDLDRHELRARAVKSKSGSVYQHGSKIHWKNQLSL